MGIDAALFVEAPGKELECTICSDVLHKPVSCPEGHTFCEACLLGWARTKQSCPTCRCPLNPRALFRVRIVENLINAMQVRCCPPRSGDDPAEPSAKRQRTDPGCPWVGRLEEREAHQQHCGFVEVPCPNGCGSQVPRRQLERHRVVCPRRLVQCTHCKGTFPLRAMGDHVAEPLHGPPTQACPKIVVECMQNCGKRMARERLQEHWDTDCPLAPVDCPYAAHGCRVRPPRCRLQQHLAEYSVQHLQMTTKVLQECRDGLTRKVSGLERFVARLEQQVTRERQQWRRQQERNDALSQEVRDLRDAVRRREKAVVAWTVRDFARRRARGAEVFSQGFVVAGYEFMLGVGFPGEGATATISLRVYHSGGATAMPIDLSGTSIVLKSQTPCHSIAKAVGSRRIHQCYASCGWGAFTTLSVVMDPRFDLCERDRLQVEATVCVGRPAVLILRDSGEEVVVDEDVEGCQHLDVDAEDVDAEEEEEEEEEDEEEEEKLEDEEDQEDGDGNGDEADGAGEDSADGEEENDYEEEEDEQEEEEEEEEDLYDDAEDTE